LPWPNKLNVLKWSDTKTISKFLKASLKAVRWKNGKKVKEPPL